MPWRAVPSSSAWRPPPDSPKAGTPRQRAGPQGTPPRFPRCLLVRSLSLGRDGTTSEGGFVVPATWSPCLLCQLDIHSHCRLGVNAPGRSSRWRPGSPFPPRAASFLPGGTRAPRTRTGFNRTPRRPGDRHRVGAVQSLSRRPQRCRSSKGRRRLAASRRGPEARSVLGRAIPIDCVPGRPEVVTRVGSVAEQDRPRPPVDDDGPEGGDIGPVLDGKAGRRYSEVGRAEGALDVVAESRLTAIPPPPTPFLGPILRVRHRPLPNRQLRGLLP